MHFSHHWLPEEGHRVEVEQEQQFGHDKPWTHLAC